MKTARTNEHRPIRGTILPLYHVTGYISKDNSKQQSEVLVSNYSEHYCPTVHIHLMY